MSDVLWELYVSDDKSSDKSFIYKLPQRKSDTDRDLRPSSNTCASKVFPTLLNAQIVIISKSHFWYHIAWTSKLHKSLLKAEQINVYERKVNKWITYLISQTVC